MYALLTVLAGAMAVGRILSAELVYEPSLSRAWPDDPGHPRRPWPATAPRAMPTFSSNDRSRWAAVRALIDHGTWVVGRRDKQVVVVSAPAALAAADPLQLAVLLEAGYDRRIKSDRGIIFEDGWQSVDKMLNPATLEYYSTKPPLLTFLTAGEYWLLKKAFGWSLGNEAPSGERDQRFAVVRACLLTFNVLPFLVYLFLLARLADRFGATDWGRLFVVTAACFGTLVTPFLITLNNHTIATCGVVVAVYAAVRILSSDRVGWIWFLLAGFAAGFTAVNELPAAAFAVGLGLLLLLRSPARMLLTFAPAALVPVAAMLALNYAELGGFDVGYSKFGGPWYEYEGSHWRNLPDQSKRGIDWARYKDDKSAYAFNLLLGHHGLFSLTPIYLLALGGMGLGVQRIFRPSPPTRARGGRGVGGEFPKTPAPSPPTPLPLSTEGEGSQGAPSPPTPLPLSTGGEGSKKSGSPLPPSPPGGGRGVGGEGGESSSNRAYMSEPLFPKTEERDVNQVAPRLWAELAVSTLLLSLVVIGYYIFKSDNYGGWTNGPRWLMWLTPLWLLTMLPVVDRLGRSRWGQVLCLALLAGSVLSAHYWDWNPWRHPWIYNWMDSAGRVPY